MPQQALHAQEWNVPSVLPTIPSNYNIGPSHVFVDDASPQMIATRVVNVLAKHSVAAVPDDNHEVRPMELALSKGPDFCHHQQLVYSLTHSLTFNSLSLTLSLSFVPLSSLLFVEYLACRG